MKITKLSHVFAVLGVKQAHVVRALATKGLTFSKASLSRLVTQADWPKTCDQEAVKAAITEYLANLGATKEQLTELFNWYEPSSKTQPEIEYEDPEPEMLTANAKQFFKLRRDPFENEIATPEDVFWIDPYRVILEDMLLAATAGSMVALHGECGSGKTIIRRAFIHNIQRDHPEVILIQPARLDRRRVTAESISTAICRALQIKHKPSAEERDAAIEEGLIESANNGHLHLMIIDEAHDLTPDVIKLLKRIWELTHGFRRVMGIVLIGQTELKKKLDGQHVREFTWRCNQIAMQPLGMFVPQYIKHKFERAGLDASKIFTDDAMSAIKGKCYGMIRHGIALDSSQLDRSYPLSVNTWTAKAMNLAAAIGEKKITEQLVLKV
ncbi:AAA family ATPase [Pseudoalteromonas sp. DL2-H2.2]|uniref:ExeA family protein n=1 Tax=Pseudoalteromonas sp. DL2-H2.2 TaxID=2908889 RepID=UPI001F339E21|nr:AAA family ATPase [Pseudoalteromonas sp. DL2-H2.2]MCF2910766.1 AAA family ATPase [Pseudoalteromonas sp. DL2-H2.2]